MTVIYTEMPGLYDAILAAGHDVWNEPAGWRSTDDAAVQALIDAYDPLAASRAARLAELAAHRYELQQAGLLIGPVRFQTDAEARANLAGAALAALLSAQAGEPYHVIWKTPEGPVPLDGATVMLAARRIEAWVRALFTREAEIATEILAQPDWRLVRDHDISVGWP